MLLYRPFSQVRFNSLNDPDALGNLVWGIRTRYFRYRDGVVVREDAAEPDRYVSYKSCPSRTWGCVWPWAHTGMMGGRRKRCECPAGVAHRSSFDVCCPVSALLPRQVSAGNATREGRARRIDQGPAEKSWLQDGSAGNRPQVTSDWRRRSRHTVRLSRSRESGVSFCRYFESAVFTIDKLFGSGLTGVESCLGRIFEPKLARAVVRQSRNPHCNLRGRRLSAVPEGRRGLVSPVGCGNIWVPD